MNEKNEWRNKEPNQIAGETGELMFVRHVVYWWDAQYGKWRKSSQARSYDVAREFAKKHLSNSNVLITEEVGYCLCVIKGDGEEA